MNVAFFCFQEVLCREAGPAHQCSLQDIDVFEAGSWAFPYLIVVPVNMAACGIILFSMYGWVAILCYVAMNLLLALQFYSNKYLATLKFEKCA